MPVFADPATSGKAGASRERRQPTCLRLLFAAKTCYNSS